MKNEKEITLTEREIVILKRQLNLKAFVLQENIETFSKYGCDPKFIENDKNDLEELKILLDKLN